MASPVVAPAAATAPAPAPAEALALASSCTPFGDREQGFWAAQLAPNRPLVVRIPDGAQLWLLHAAHLCRTLLFGEVELVGEDAGAMTDEGQVPLRFKRGLLERNGLIKVTPPSPTGGGCFGGCFGGKTPTKAATTPGKARADAPAAADLLPEIETATPKKPSSAEDEKPPEDGDEEVKAATDATASA